MRSGNTRSSIDANIRDQTDKPSQPQANAGTWPGRPRSGLAGAKKHGLTDVWEKFVTKGVCWGCGGDWGYTGGLKVDIDSSEYTGYRYCYSRPGYRQRARSWEDARFIHINFVLLAEVKHFEKVSTTIIYIFANRDSFQVHIGTSSVLMVQPAIDSHRLVAIDVHHQAFPNTLYT
ncbi:hypothetical protein SFRURICE_010666 [Spodoptera frugiperda]|nr:hypothetical protein SFRURICE_010666 [Spodoptera frugiperda]